MISRAYTAQPDVVGGTIVTVEADVEEVKGKPDFTLVGLAGRSIDEAKDRVGSALKNTGFPTPKIGNQRIIISLAPADVKKDGPLFDLSIAIAYLAARGYVTSDITKTIFLGELALDGTIHGVRGVLPAVALAKKHGFTEIIVPEGNAREASLVDGIAVFSAKTVKDVVNHINGITLLARHPQTVLDDSLDNGAVSFDEIRGQETAKRGLIIATAGKHNAILVGPPGTGKTMLARAIPGILPQLSLDDALQVMAIHSYAGTLSGNIFSTPPFRSPHHSASHAAMNPSRGGDDGDNYSEQMLTTYKNKISGPILDRIDLWLPVPHIPHDELASVNMQQGETERAREQIMKARERQERRFEHYSISVNSEMTARILDEAIELSSSVRDLLVRSAEKMKLSPRSYHRLVKTARTIADLADCDEVREEHVLEALQYRVRT